MSSERAPGRLKNKRALVTGANSGIGKAIAIRLAQDGADVVINFIAHPEDADQVAEQCRGYGVRALTAKADISDEAQVAAMFESMRSELGGVEILVNNAGFETNHLFLEMPVADWRKVIDVNLTGAFICAQAAARMMVNSGHGGSIVNITSVHQIIPWGGYVHYCVSKAGLDMMTKTAALELADKGVRVNTVAPGAVATAINRNVWEDPVGLKDLLRKIPSDRMGQPEEIASAVAFLSSDEASYITGASLLVDGGMTLFPEFRHGG